MEAVQSPVWLELREATSAAVMYYLLATAALFKPLPNNNLIQITGKSIDVTAQSIQALKLDARVDSPCISMMRARHVSIKKVSIVYANPLFFSAEKKVRYGLWPQRKLTHRLQVGY